MRQNLVSACTHVRNTASWRGYQFGHEHGNDNGCLVSV